MQKKYHHTLFIFRRDLRLDDNTALIEALNVSTLVIPCFIFDPCQYADNPYKSKAAVQFMLESLADLQQQMQAKKAHLYFFEGETETVVEKLINTLKIDAIYFNRDYTPFSQKRDSAIAKICKKHQIDCVSLDDALLHAPAETLKPDGTPYQVFSRFYDRVRLLEVLHPQKNDHDNFYKKNITFAASGDLFKKILPTTNPQIAIKGGRMACLQQLRQLKHLNYDAWHNFPAKAGSSLLSPHLKFTTCSVREVYFAMKKQMTHSQAICRELYWRDFFTMIGYYFPHVFKGAYRQKYDAIEWQNNSKFFKAWCEGRTGFPIVDAGMRELNATGYMHNRVRLITASFLVKDLHIDWRKGEKYFAQKLIDYDPAVNNGNWQWVASTGTDAQPYFRIFNPWLQQRKFDETCEYIKKWVPELATVDKKIIHQWFKDKYHGLVPNYNVPLIDHAVEAAKAKKYFEQVGR
jgi:deoxyribodipyrimidine photo-lyase